MAVCSIRFQPRYFCWSVSAKLYPISSPLISCWVYGWQKGISFSQFQTWHWSNTGALGSCSSHG
jgi:hypothetical protein